MESIRIDILNPKAKKLLQDLADLNLIAFQSNEESNFSTFLERIRSKSDSELSLEEISLEVKRVRKSRNDK
ncbi:conserved hypothetical protein [Marinoscillum sp. 108]|nr:conserved hypothetical protein [Marinoscillum sp. 108]